MPRKKEPFNEIWELFWSFAKPHILGAAVESGLLNALSKRAYTPQGVAGKLKLNRELTRKFLSALNAMGILSFSKGRFEVKRKYKPYFDADSPIYFGDAAPHYKMMNRAWGESLTELLHGRPAPQRRPPSPESQELFIKAMKAMSRLYLPKWLDAMEFSGVETILDLGAGIGTFCIEICKVHPGIRATLLDRPESVPAMEKEIDRVKLAGQLRVVGGDYFKTDPGGKYDLVLLNNIVHQELKKDAVRLLKQARRFLAPGGRVAITEFRIDDRKIRHPFGTLFAINMRDFGDTYSHEELKDFAKSAGFSRTRRTLLDENRLILEAWN